MIYITGDTHRDFRRVETFCNVTETTKDDILIILGDVGINYYGRSNDNWLKEELSKLANHVILHTDEVYPAGGFPVIHRPEYRR